MMRYIAKNLVASGVLNKCEVSVSYAIGKAEPTSVNVDSFGTSEVSNEVLISLVMDLFDLRPKAIINILNLTKPIFSKTSSGGHFGKDEFTWEKLDKVDSIKNWIGNYNAKKIFA